MWRKPDCDCGVVTAADAEQEWLIPWFHGNLTAHNKCPVRLVDGGMTPEGLRVCAQLGIEVIAGGLAGWWTKPAAILKCGFDHIVWLDLDCEVLGDITPLFEYLSPYLAMHEDRPYYASPWAPSLLPDEIMYNSGVIAVSNGLEVISVWEQACKRSRDAEITFRSDQEVLARVLFYGGQRVTRMHAEYNNLRLEGKLAGAVIRHYTGSDGKQYIRDLLSLRPQLII